MSVEWMGVDGNGMGVDGTGMGVQNGMGVDGNGKRSVEWYGSVKIVWECKMV